MRPSLPWYGPVEIEVVLDFPEIGQHVVPAPAGGAARFPLVVIGRRAAVGHLAVDRGAAAQHARLLVFPQGWPGLVGIVVADDLGGDLEFGPVEARIEIRRSRIAVANFGRFVARRRVLAGFAEQDLVGAFGGQAMGHDGARRPAADDDVVVHCDVSPFVFSLEASAAPTTGHGHPDIPQLRPATCRAREPYLRRCTANTGAMDAPKLRALTDWLIDGGRSAASPSRFMAECCERMVEAGLPLWRVGVFVRTLHPEIFGRNFIWKPGSEVELGTVDYDILESPDFHTSPLIIVFQQGLEVRARTDDPREQAFSDHRRASRRRRHGLLCAAAALHRRHGECFKLDHQTAGWVHR